MACLANKEKFYIIWHGFFLAPDHLNLVQVQITNENNMQWCPEFIDLVSLTLGSWCLESNFYGLTVFLQNSPKLEKLRQEIDEVQDFCTHTLKC